MSQLGADAGELASLGSEPRSTVLEYAVSKSPVVYFIAEVTDGYRLRFISPNIEAITGHKPTSFLNDPDFAWRQTHPEDVDSYANALQDLYRTGSSVVEYRLRNAAGEYLWFRDDLRLSTLGQDRKQITGCMIEITSRKRAEDEQHRVSRLLNDALESIPNGFAVYDATGELVLCNTAFASLYGREPKDMAGLDVAESHRIVMSQVHSFDGKELEGGSLSLAQSRERLRETSREPLEVQLKNGEWKLITSHPTAEGGVVFIRTDITQLKQAEATARESERRFRRIVEANPLPVSVVDAETATILYESPAAAALFGRPWPSEETLHAIDRYADPADRQPFIETLRRRGELYHYELQLKKADGTRFWAVLTSRLILHEGRETIITSMVDLTERKQREEELRRAREMLEDAIESLSEGFALWDAEDRLVMCNQQYRDFNPESADALVPGVKWIDFLRAGAERGQYVDAVGRVEEWLQERAVRRRGFGAKLDFEQSDGRWFEFSNQRTRQGGIVVTRTEITHRKEMERALRESERLIRGVLEACPVPVCMAGVEDGLIIYESPASKELFGRGRAPNHPEFAQDFYVDVTDREGYLAALRERGAVDDFRVQLKKSDGTPFWASLSARLIDYQGEKVIVSSMFDLTERLAFEEEMARQRDAVYQSEKLSALGSLLAGVAHELNNPLSVVVGQALLLEETITDARIADRAAKISTAAERCSRIVKSFLAMARQEAPRRSQVDVNGVVESCLDMTGYVLRTANVEVVRKLAADLPTIWADGDQLNQVLTNLIINARQAIEEGADPRRLEIVTKYLPRWDKVRIKVSDTGPGIPPDVRSRIFEPFFTTKRVGAGTGLGLAVCHGIVASHHGKITVESKPAQGATFVVTLPRQSEDEPAALPEEHRTHPAASARVLIVDDEPEVLQTLKEILSLEGHRIETADSGETALGLLAQGAFDAVISDLRMPNLDGPSLYRKLREEGSSLARRIALITGDTLDPNTTEFLQETGLPYLEKPFSPDEVRRLVERVLTRSPSDAKI